MAKTANLYVRIEPELKEQAEDILSILGISVSSAINMFYRQIILQNGIPFEMRIPAPGPETGIVDIGRLTREELDAEIELGFQDMLAGRVIPAEEAYAEMKKKFDIEL